MHYYDMCISVLCEKISMSSGSWVFVKKCVGINMQASCYTQLYGFSFQCIMPNFQTPYAQNKQQREIILSVRGP